MNNKYLFFNDKGVTVKIERKGFFYIKEFYYRLNGGRDNTIKKAIENRDQIHKDKFGYIVSSRFFHTKKKKVKNGRSNSLPAGISYGYSRGKLLYIVASWSPLPNKIKRKRFNIKKLGYDKALEEAVNYRAEMICNIILS